MVGSRVLEVARFLDSFNYFSLLLSWLNRRNSKFKAFREALEPEHVWYKRMLAVKHCSGKHSNLGLN